MTNEAEVVRTPLPKVSWRKPTEEDLKSDVLAAVTSAAPIWQPIDTAPKDGALVDLWVKPHGAFGNGNPCRIPNAWWSRNSWMRALGFMDYAEVSECGEPTHWMPLPAAPGTHPPSPPASFVGGVTEAERMAARDAFQAHVRPDSSAEAGLNAALEAAARARPRNEPGAVEES